MPGNSVASDPSAEQVAQPPQVAERGSYRSLLPIAAWCVAGGLLFVAALRFVARDANFLLNCLNSFTLYIYLPAYLVLAFALWQGRKWLSAAALLVIACHVVWVAPDFTSATPLEATASDSRPLRVMFFNAYRYSTDHQGILDEIAAVKPDVLVFAEFFEPWKQALLQAAITDKFPYGTDLAGWNGGDVVVFSRIPIERPEPTWVGNRAYITFDVPLDGGKLRMLCLHSPRPMPLESHDYHGFWQAVLPAIRDQPRPLVVMGDFNATQHSAIYQQITDMGLRSSHVDRGRGYATTWPNGRLPIPPIRIDHAFLSPEVECLRCVEGIGAGSDHRPLVLDLRLKPAANQK